jgi:hypothetical protein
MKYLPCSKRRTASLKRYYEVTWEVFWVTIIAFIYNMAGKKCRVVKVNSQAFKCSDTLFHRSTAPVGYIFLILEVLRSHPDTPHLLGLPWTSDQPDAQTSTSTHTTIKGDRHQRHRRKAEFETAIPANQRRQTHALDRTTTRTGSSNITSEKFPDLLWGWDSLCLLWISRGNMSIQLSEIKPM